MKRGYGRRMEKNRPRPYPESGFDAQVGALLDRVHKSASFVDSLMAMPLPGEKESAPEWDAAVAPAARSAARQCDAGADQARAGKEDRLKLPVGRATVQSSVSSPGTCLKAWSAVTRTAPTETAWAAIIMLSG